MSQSPSYFDLSGFQRDLLYVISGCDSPSGQAIRRTLERHVSTVGHGKLYPNLDILVEQSLVEKGEKDKRTNYYRITETGMKLLHQRREWENAHLPDSQTEPQPGGPGVGSEHNSAAVGDAKQNP